MTHLEKFASIFFEAFKETKIETRDITCCFGDMKEGQFVALDDKLFAFFPLKGEDNNVDPQDWLKCDGLVELTSTDMVMQYVRQGDQKILEAYFCKAKCTEVLLELMNRVMWKGKMNERITVEWLKEQFDGLWDSCIKMSLPDPADVRKVIKERYEQKRTDREGMGTC